MANHRSSEKRARQTIRKNKINSRREKNVKTIEKKLRVAIKNKEVDGSQALLKLFTSGIAKMAKKGIVHLNTASRKISRLSTQVYQMKK